MRKQTRRLVLLAGALYAICASCLAAPASNEPPPGWKPLVIEPPPAQEEVALRDRTIAEVGTAWRKSDFAMLERLAANYGTRRSPSGLWLHNFFYVGLSSAIDPETAKAGGWAKVEKKIERWRQAFPKSNVPPIVLARLTSARAWEVRDDGYASTVKAEAWPVFRNRQRLP